MLDYFAYLAFRAGTWILTLLPLGPLFGLGQAAGTLAWLIAIPYRRLALRNVRIAFGEQLPDRQLRRIVRQHFQRLGANLLCSFKLAEMPIEKILERVTLENFEHIESCLRQGRPLVLLLSHVGSWELCARIFPHFVPDYRKSTIYQPIRNRYIDRHVREARSRFGVEVFDRSEGFGQPLALLRQGGGVAVLCDQHAGDGGLWTPFLGRLASTTPLPALLARRTHAQVSAFAVYTDGFARWRAVAEAPIERKDDSIESLTARGNRVIEAQVRRAPADWFWVHNRWKTPDPKFLLANYKRGVFLPDDAGPLQPFRILLRSSKWLGDAVMSVPAVRAIKRGRPDAHITIAAPASIADLWREVPEVDEVLVLPRKSLLAAVSTIRRQRRFEVAVLFPNSLRSALEVFLAGVPRRVGHAGHHRRWLLNQIPRDRRPRGIQHQAVSYLRLAASGGAIVRGELFFPQAPPRARADLRLALCPGAEYGPAKRWLPERFAEVANEISRTTGAHWRLFGTAGDAAIGRQIAEALGSFCENRIGQTTLAQLIVELRACDLLLTNDTGTMHLAALLGLPTVSVFGSTETRRSSPLGASHRVVRHHVECSPCFLRECPLDFRCMREVSSAEVIGAIRQRLDFLASRAPAVLR